MCFQGLFKNMSIAPFLHSLFLILTCKWKALRENSKLFRTKIQWKIGIRFFWDVCYPYKNRHPFQQDRTKLSNSKLHLLSFDFLKQSINWPYFKIIYKEATECTCSVFFSINIIIKRSKFKSHSHQALKF